MRTGILRAALAAAAILTATSAFHEPVTAQSGADRPRVYFEQLPHLAREVWPAELNGDGITDLVAGTGSPSAGVDVVAQLGHGDGTFAPPYVIGDGLSMPVGVGDVNGNGTVDVVAMNPATVQTAAAYFILPGRGDGTFDPPVTISAVVEAPTQVLDMNGDGRMDLVASRGDTILIHPGRGNFTFDAPVSLRTTGFEKESQIAVG